MDNPLVAGLLFIGIPLAFALGGFTVLRRRGSRPAVAGCGAIVLGLFASALVVAATTLTIII
jgi:hypothetical protein